MQCAPHMDPLTSAAASGLRARMEALDMLGNNIANALTSGFKRDGEFYAIFQQADLEPASDDSLMPMVEKNWTDLSQGVLQNTGNSLDFALSGPGFFSVNGPSGPLYTRSGNFRISSAGVVTTAEGYTVRTVGGGALQVKPNVPLVTTANGTVTQDGLPIGQLDVKRFAEGELAKQGSTMFRAVDQKNAGAAATDTEVHQGKLENANVSSPEAAVRLVSLMREFEGLQRAISIGNEMNRKAIEEVARV